MMIIPISRADHERESGGCGETTDSRENAPNFHGIAQILASDCGASQNDGQGGRVMFLFFLGRALS
jgi:hypothetical protein